MPYFKATKADEQTRVNRVLYIYAESLVKAEQALADRGVSGYSDFKYHSEHRGAVPDDARCIGSPEQHPTYISPIFEHSGQVIQLIVIIGLGVCLGMLAYSVLAAVIGMISAVPCLPAPDGSPSCFVKSSRLVAIKSPLSDENHYTGLSSGHAHSCLDSSDATLLNEEPLE